MAYSYQEQRPWLFTEQGQVALLSVRDRVFSLLKLAGAVRAQEAWRRAHVPDSWKQLAILDRLVELGDIRAVTPADVPGQHAVYVRNE